MPLELTLGNLLDQAAGHKPNSPALVDLPTNTRLTYAEFAQKTDQLARGFIALGLLPGDHLALWAPNQPQWLICQFACAKAGLILVNLDISLDEKGLKFILENADVRALVLAKGINQNEFFDTLQALRKKPGLPAELKHLILTEKAPDSALPSLDDIAAKADEASQTELKKRMQIQSPGDQSSLIYTSGTTGRPKGVMLSHRGLLNTSFAAASIQGLDHTDKLLITVPLSHMFGCICLTMPGILARSCLIIPSRLPEPKTTLKAAYREKATAIYGAPTTFMALMEQPDYRPDMLASLRTGIMAGAVCPLEVMEKVVNQMGIKDILIGYGQTEASSWISLTRPDDILELRVSTVGRPIEGVEVIISDPETGRALPRGSIGEIRARGFNMLGYKGLETATKETLDQEGWLLTGDLASMDENGYLRIFGRVKEAIIKDNQVVFPSRIEAVLLKHPQVADAQAFAVSVGDHKEEVAVWIRVLPEYEPNIEEIKGFCDQRLSPLEQPEHYKIVKSFPMTALGKPKKFVMRKQFMQELGLT
ncbi:AMP-binding protein [Dethiosulfatarculus sandiegensis]|uniref:AMP-binding protein n=1 Tax=Dethiosulfatarculus sandiegensis TaxID=1429043 RepID=UPI0005CB60FD|nr:AMP-binding protein [Dethiosulfatarculus sandiegensis]